MLAVQCSVTVWIVRVRQAFNKCKSIFWFLQIYRACTVYVAFVCHVPRFSQMNGAALQFILWITTIFVDTRLSKTKHPWKPFQNFRQSCMLSTDRIEIHQSQPLVWPSDLDNTHDWRKFWKRFRGCFLLESRVSTKTVVSFSRFYANIDEDFDIWVVKLLVCQASTSFV